MPSDALKNVFNAFCSYGAGSKDVVSTLDGRGLTKLCKDAGLIKDKVTATDIDLIFAKVKAKAERKITYQQFVEALKHIAAKKGVAAEEVEQAVISCGGPTSNATKADAVKFHDDKSLYTGVYANGGPKAVDSDKVADLSKLTNRKAADVRGVNK